MRNIISYNSGMEKYIFTDQIAAKFKDVGSLPDWLRNYPDFNDQIKVLRETMGMTQEQLAAKIGRTLRTVQKIENGEARPKINTLEKIARALNTELHISLVPNQNITKFLDILAEKKAKEILKISADSSAFELQTPSKSASHNQLEQLKKKILEKKRTVLWSQKKEKT